MENFSHKEPGKSTYFDRIVCKEVENLQLTNNLNGYSGRSLDKDEDRLRTFIISLIEEIWQFNENVGSDLEPILISSYRWLETNFVRIAKEAEKKVNNQINKPTRDFSWKSVQKILNIIQWLRKEQQLYLDVFNDSEYLTSEKCLNSINSDRILHYLRKNPTHLIENWSVTLSKVLKCSKLSALIRKMKYWNYTPLNIQSINKCHEIINETNSEENVEQKCGAVLALSILKESSDFLALVTGYYPTESKVDVFTDTSGGDYQIRKSCAKSLINIAVPQLAFEAIQKFCVGDYSKITIGSLYTQVKRAPSKASLEFLYKQLINAPVSIHKHIIRLYFQISSVDDKICALREIKSNNVSIRFTIFLHAHQLFRSSPSQETWTILKAIMKRTSEDDEPILKFLFGKPKLDACPLEYISDYVLDCLALLRKLQPQNVCRFISNLLVIITKIPENTLDKIVMHNYKNEETFDDSFCLKYLLSSSSESNLKHRLSNIWLILNNVTALSWEKRKPNGDYPIRSLVLKFIKNLCHDIEGPFKALICQTLFEKFKAVSTTKFFKEILYINLALLLVAEVKYEGIERLRRFGRSLARSVDASVDQYGGEWIFIAKDTIKLFVNTHLSDKYDGMVVKLVDAILKKSNTSPNQILSITFLQNINLKKNPMFDKISKLLKKSNDYIVQAYYSSVSQTENVNERSMRFNFDSINF